MERMARPDYPIYPAVGSVLKFNRNKKNWTLAILSNFIKFSKIRYNSAEFQLDDVLYSKNPTNKKMTEFTD
jgi:hypothetical protein